MRPASGGWTHALPLSTSGSEEGLECLYDELVVVHLGEAGDRDRAYATGAPEEDREGAAVCRVGRWVKP